MALKYFISILWGIFFLFRIEYFCQTFLFLFKVLSNPIFFYKKGVRVDVGFVMKEKKMIQEIGVKAFSASLYTTIA